VGLDEAAQHPQVALHLRAEALAAMGGEDEQPLAARGLESGCELGRGRPLAQGGAQGVHHRVAGANDAAGRHAFGLQRLHVVGRRGEMQRGDPGDQPPVQLLGEGSRQVSRAQPRLDVADRNAAMEGGQGAGCGRRRVALHQQQLRGALREQGVEPLEHPGGHGRGGLSGAHDLQIVVDPDAELGREGVEQVRVLGGRHRLYRQPIPRLEGTQDRRQLDDLGPGPEEAEHPFHAGEGSHSRRSRGPGLGPGRGSPNFECRRGVEPPASGAECLSRAGRVPMLV
jgi:hypothetical protein